MRVDFLHRRVLTDVRALHHDLGRVMPDVMPERYATRATNIGAFVKRINTVTAPHGIWNEVTVVERPEIYAPGRLRFCGEWHPKELREQARQRQDITIHWLIHPSTRRVTFTRDKWAFWVFTYWVYIMHELIHRHQFTQRPDDASCRVYRPAAKESENTVLHEEQLYLGEYDEIEAHAHDIAFELLALYPDLPFRDAMRQMRHTDYRSASVGGLVTYPVYRQAFSGVRNHPVMPVLHRKIRLWYRQLKQYRDVYEDLGMFPLSRRVIRLGHQDI